MESPNNLIAFLHSFWAQLLAFVALMLQRLAEGELIITEAPKAEAGEAGGKK